MDKKCKSCNTCFSDVLIRCPNCGAIPGKNDDSRLTDDQIRTVSRQVRKDFLKTILFWLGIISLLFGVGLYQIYQGATKEMQSFLVQGISKEFEQPRIRETIQDVAAKNAQKILKDEIQPEVVKFTQEIELKTDDFRAAIDASQKRLDDVALKLAELERQTEEKIHELSLRPSFHQEMFSILTNIPASIFRDFHTGSDYYEAKDYDKALQLAQRVISAYERGKPYDLKGYSAEEHQRMAGEFYILASKSSQRLEKHDLAYEYSKEAVKINSTHYSHYVLAANAYNLKRYDESLEMINKAISLRPPEESMALYQKIKEKCLSHIANR